MVVERRRVASTQNDVKSVAERLQRNRSVPVKLRDQPIARGFVRSAVKDWIEGNQRIAREKHLCDKPRGERRTEYGEMKMRRAPGIVGVGPRIFARPDRHEAIAAFGIRQRVTTAREIGIERRIVLIVVM